MPVFMSELEKSFLESSGHSEQESPLYDLEGSIAFTSTPVMGAEKRKGKVGKNHKDHQPIPLPPLMYPRPRRKAVGE